MNVKQTNLEFGPVQVLCVGSSTHFWHTPDSTPQAGFGSSFGDTQPIAVSAFDERFDKSSATARTAPSVSDDFIKDTNLHLIVDFICSCVCSYVCLAGRRAATALMADPYPYASLSHSVWRIALTKTG